MLVLPLLAVLASEPAPSPTHPFGLDIVLGLGTPTGLIGGVLDWTPTPYLSLEAGLGYDRTFSFFPDAGGFQWSVMPRLRTPNDGVSLSVGAGMSGGHYEWCDSCPFENGDVWTWSHALWFNFETALEYRWQAGAALRLVIGGADLLNRDDVTCQENRYGCGDIAPARQSIQPYFGLAVRIPLTEE